MRCGEYIGSAKKVADICELRTVKAAVASLRTIDVNRDRRRFPDAWRELRRYVAGRCMKSLFVPYGTTAGRISALLSTLSLKLELMVWHIREKKNMRAEIHNALGRFYES